MASIVAPTLDQLDTWSTSLDALAYSLDNSIWETSALREVGSITVASSATVKATGGLPIIYPDADAGAARRRGRQEDVLTAEELRQIWRGSVYVPATPAAEKPKETGDAPPEEAIPIVANAMPITPADVQALRNRAAETGVLNEVSREIAGLQNTVQAYFVAEEIVDEEESALLLLDM
jgi:hypothetical protein